MQTRLLLLAVIVGGGVATGIAAAAPADQKQTDQQQADSGDDQADPVAGRGRLGFAALQISPGLRAFLGAPSDRGVLVDQLRPDSPAARAGLRVGDVILEVDAAPARTVDDIIGAISDRKKGDVVAVRVERGRAPVSLQIKLDSDPGPRLDRPTGRWRHLGRGEAPFGLNELFSDPETRQELEATRKQLQQLEQRVEKLEHR